MTVDDAVRRRLVESVAAAVIDQADRLGELDRAIGDGDHGINMRRGFEAVLGELDDIAAKPLPEALVAVGMKLVMTVGGASGPLYGTLFMALGRNLPGDGAQREEVARAFLAAVDAVRARGRSDAGQKTMLDVLVPVHEALADGRTPEYVARIADEAARATIPMKAIRGRASFLGERSVGHMDPGACSSALMTGAVCKVLQEVRQ